MGCTGGIINVQSSPYPQALAGMNLSQLKLVKSRNTFQDPLKRRFYGYFPPVLVPPSLLFPGDGRTSTLRRMFLRVYWNNPPFFPPPTHTHIYIHTHIIYVYDKHTNIYILYTHYV